MNQPQKYQINIKSLRENINLTQKEVANHLGIEQTVYSRYETGKNDIKPYQLIKLCNFYKVSADYILDLPEGRPYGNNHVRHKNKPTSKFDKLADEIQNIIYWAREQNHISYEAEDILIENIIQTINELQGEIK